MVLAFAFPLLPFCFKRFFLRIFFFSSRRNEKKIKEKKNHREEKKCREGKELSFKLLLCHVTFGSCFCPPGSTLLFQTLFPNIFFFSNRRKEKKPKEKNHRKKKMERKEGAYLQAFALPFHFWLLLLTSCFYPFISSNFSLIYSCSQAKEKKRKCKKGRELTFLLSLLHLGESIPLAFSFAHSFNIEFSTFLKPYVSYFLEALCYSSSGVLPSSRDGMSGR